MRVFSLIPALLLAGACMAQVEGDWMLTLNHQTERLGIITFEREQGELRVYVDGGPVEYTLNGNQLEMTVDYRNAGGRLLSRTLSGTIDGDVMTGTLVAPHDGSTGTWRAEPRVPDEMLPPAPVDFSGIWSRISAGMEKVHLDYTDSAQAIVDEYSYLDDPALRCISPALVRISGWPYPLEILQDDRQVTILYESFREVRRIFLDGREFPEDIPISAMGYSIGHWEGSTLVVESSLLKPAFVDQAGQPISENARVVERISMSEDGQNLRSLLTLHDPENYRRPIIRYRQWRRTPDTTIFEYDCDSYPFYRGLELEGRLDEFWERMSQQR
ncbi:MAG: hypothetical protein F4122_12235 [Gammaproteobacteria bacterium]|nr:hypothetical protein [Gammaproteobacteria bacterium]